MDYKEWNDCIASYLFNEDKYGEEVFLYLTKDDIVQLYKNQIKDNKTDFEIWNTFVSVINEPKFEIVNQGERHKVAIPSSESVIERIINLYNYNKSTHYGPNNYPLYISILITLILPITELASDDSILNISSGNYYDRAKKYFDNNNIRFDKIKNHDFTSSSFKKICIQDKYKGFFDLWDDLENWTTKIKDCKWGVFTKRCISNDKYVGIIRAQSLLTADEIRKLPSFFLAANLEVGEKYSKDDFCRAIIKYGKGYLKQLTIDFLLKNQSNSFKDIILGIIIDKHSYWDGKEYEYDQYNNVKRISKTAVKKVKLQLKKEGNRFTINYRLYSNIDFDDSWIINSESILEECNGWSYPLNISFTGNSWNKGIIKFEAKELYLFKRTQELPSSRGVVNFIEEKQLNKYEEMYILCKNDISSTIETWGIDAFSQGNFIKMDANCLSLNSFTLFRIQAPLRGNNNYQELSISTEKEIALIGGLKVGNRKYLKTILPHITLYNCDGTEKLFLKYDLDEKYIFLEKRIIDGQIYWILPMDIKTGVPFVINIENEKQNKDFRYEICEIITESTTFFHPKDKFGNDIDNKPYISGNNIFGLSDVTYSLEIVNKDPLFSLEKSIYSYKDIALLDWIYCKKEFKRKDFNEAYDAISRAFKIELDEENIIDRKRIVLNMLHYAGVIEYDYKKSKIKALPPEFIALPSNGDIQNRALLIGCYTSNLINKIQQYCEENSNRGKLRLYVENQSKELNNFLLPCTVYIEVLGFEDSNYGFSYLKELAQNCDMPETACMDLQSRLFTFCPNVKDFGVRYDILGEFYESCPQLFFDRKMLKFVAYDDCSNIFDDILFVEFHSRAWAKEYGLVKITNGIKEACFIDKNWGRYFILEKYCVKESNSIKGAKISKKIFYDKEQGLLAINVGLPLPELFNKGLIFMTGRLPVRRRINIDGVNEFYNIYNCTNNLRNQSHIKKIFLTKMNLIIETIKI